MGSFLPGIDGFATEALSGRALLAARLGAFVLTAGNLTGEEMADVFRRALPAMDRFAKKYAPPFIAKVRTSGAVSMLLAGTRT